MSCSPVFITNLDQQDVELAISGKFDAVLDTIGVPETERYGINFLKRGGHYMTLQVTDKSSSHTICHLGLSHHNELSYAFFFNSLIYPLTLLSLLEGRGSFFGR